MTAEEIHEVETLKQRVLAMRGGMARDSTVQSPTNMHSRDHDSQSTPISLDVGGIVYTVSRSVLKAVPDSWLAMVSNGSISLPRTAQDIRFIDRDAQAFRYVINYLRGLVESETSTLSNTKSAATSIQLPSSRDDLSILQQECKYYGLPDLESEVSKALKAAPSVAQSLNPSGTVTATTASGVVDDTTDIYSKACKMQLEFQSVYVTISSSNGLQFTEEERHTAMGEVNARTAELQGSGFRVKAMNTGVAQDRKTKDYCMYFHAVLVKSTGKRVPAVNGESHTINKPHEASVQITSTNNSAASVPQNRQSATAGRSPRAVANSSSNSKRSTAHTDHYIGRGEERGSFLGERQYSAPHNHRLPEPSAPSASGTPKLRSSLTAAPAFSKSAVSRNSWSAAHDGIEQASPNQAPPTLRSPNLVKRAGMSRDESAPPGHSAGKEIEVLHTSTGANSVHGKSCTSQQVNTSSTIDSMLAAGQSQGLPSQQSVSSTADVQKAHAAALANFGLPNDIGPRRHSDVRVFDIYTDGPPRGIPREWEEGLLEGRKRPVSSPSIQGKMPDGPVKEHVKGETRISSMDARSDDVQVAAQNAAEASIAEAKRRAAAAKAKMAMKGPRTLPSEREGSAATRARSGPKSSRSASQAPKHDAPRIKPDKQHTVDATEVSTSSFKPRTPARRHTIETPMPGSNRQRFRVSSALG